VKSGADDRSFAHANGGGDSAGGVEVLQSPAGVEVLPAGTTILPAKARRALPRYHLYGRVGEEDDVLFFFSA
jgi:hypothetical protein